MVRVPHRSASTSGLDVSIPSGSAKQPEPKVVFTAWSGCLWLAVQTCSAIMEGSFVIHQAPVHIFGSGPTGKGSVVSNAGILILSKPPKFALASLRALLIMWYTLI